MVKKIRLDDVKTNAGMYIISGNMQNGWQTIDGVRVPIVEKEYIHRPIKYINREKGILECTCGREFIIDDDLKISEQ